MGDSSGPRAADIRQQGCVPALAACGGLRPNRPNAGGAGGETRLNEESRTWKRIGGAGSEAPERYETRENTRLQEENWIGGIANIDDLFLDPNGPAFTREERRMGPSRSRYEWCRKGP
jgi:hypothetical protein